MLGKLRMMAGAAALAGLIAGVAGPGAPAAAAAEPIKIGLGMALTGGLAGNGKAALLALQIWEDDINAKGGILGRPVKLVSYDDQSNPSTVPGIYSKLIDVDKVDLVLSGYGTNQIAPAMPVIMQRGMVFMALFALSLNEQFHYPYYFDIQPTGPDGKVELSRGFFDLAMAQQPKPQTVAIVAADAEFAKAAAEGARENAKRVGLKIVYDKTYPPSTVDYTPVVRAVQATNPDIVFVGSYPPDSAGIIRAASEIGLKAKMFGGGMVGLQFAALKTQLGAMLNGIVDFDYYVPAPTLNFTGIENFIKRYQAKAGAAGVDPLGFYLPPYAYAEGQILAEAAEATHGLDQKKMGDYIRSHVLHTIVGDIKFADNGEWATPRVLEVQFQGIKGNDLDQFKKPSAQVVLYPAAVKSGKLIYPYNDAQR
ncbi:MAG TPA: amino acid ABC transporter substrate-binding protein [Alphaproteobacteria bacterium]|nr:amino acid ABC transporter substrate-binding protein [Alphaproteobacteria bacterium]